MKNQNINWITPDWLAPPNVRALTTCRQGGVSVAPYESLNLALHVGDEPAHVAKNRAMLREQAGLPAEPGRIEQVHGIQAIDGASLALDQPPPPADAVYTSKADVVCGVLTADCMPVLLCDKAGTWVAAVHAGWRGLAKGVIEATLRCYPGTKRDNILAWLGPGIGPSAFRVSDDVVDAFSQQGFQINDDVFKPLAEPNKYLGNLYTLARQNLQSLGVLSSNIFGGTYCTYTQAADFYSYRRDKVTGRMMSAIWLCYILTK